MAYWETIDEFIKETGSDNRLAMKIANRLVKMGMPLKDSIEIAIKKANDKGFIFE